MNKRFLQFLLPLCISGLFLTNCSSTSMRSKTPTSKQNEQAANASRNLIMYYDPAVGKEKLLETIEAYGAKLLFDYENLHGVAIQIPKGKSIEKAIAYFKKVKGVVSVSQDEVMQVTEPQS
ncbi:hypothetical protein [Sphingobacterium deserti]|uniref:Inhibitor I9 domain-containing protein n=1 Tax=Sphingobacterium deserti TaxID=1229276 RepID=A0A0B8SZ95_9SPHI|nr:hypothetical protein [Sphingobacterium deserti]KGE13022.1 hypothetical protein DI53_3239 [Sphingobacterium deserti]